jgi:hypothetical protein
MVSLIHNFNQITQIQLNQGKAHTQIKLKQDNYYSQIQSKHGNLIHNSVMFKTPLRVFELENIVSRITF